MNARLRRLLVLSLVAVPTLLQGCGCSDRSADLSEATSEEEAPPPPFDESLRRSVSFIETEDDNGPWTLEERRAFYRVPGVAVVAWSEGRPAIAAAFGDAGEDRAMTVDTQVFMGPHVTTAFSSLVVAAQLSANSRNLNEPLGPLASSFALPDTLRDRTLGQLLSHSAGIGPEQIPGDVTTIDSFLARRAVARFPAGRESSFSETGYAVVQRYFEEVTLRPFDDLARRLLIEPLDLTTTRMGGPTTGQATAALHDRLGRVVRAEPGPALAVDGLYSSAADLATLVQAVQRTLTRDLTGVFTVRQARFAIEEERGGWGMGWQVDRGTPDQGDEVFFAFDRSGSHFVLGFEDRVAGFAIVTTSEGGARLAREIAIGIATHYGWTVPASVRSSSRNPSWKMANELVGEYDLAGRSFSLMLENGELRLVPGQAFPGLIEGEPRTLIGLAQGHWILPDSPVEFRFREGEPAAILVDGVVAVRTQRGEVDADQLE